MSQAVAKTEEKDTVNALLQRSQAQIMRALPRHVTPDRFSRIVLTEIRKNPELGLCDPMSLLGAIIQCAQLGLEPGSGLGHAYLIPFNNRKRNVKEVQFIPGYRGLIDLARRSGQVETISARIVHEKDFFRFQYGDEEKIEHVPFEGAEEEAGRITHAYAVARLKGGGVQREVMTRTQIDRVRDRKQGSNPVWDSDFDEMARKTVVRRIAKYLPLSPEVAAAIEKDDAHFKGEGQENWRVLDADYEPKPAAHDPTKIAATSAAGSAPQSAAEVDADKRNAIAVFSQAVGAVKKRGGDPVQIIGLTINEVLLKDANTILHKSDILNEWRPA
jgi:recombination protein RecT